MASVTVQALKAGEPYGHARVRAELTDLNGTATVGYVDGVIVAPLTLTASGSGVATFELVPNEGITPANTYYTVTIDSHTFLIDVPAEGGNMEDLAVDDSQELGASLFTAYEEFLADSQTPYFISADDSDPDPVMVSPSSTAWVGNAAKIAGGGPHPAYPLPALSSPFIGPGSVTNALGYGPTPLYEGPGAFKTLKTGVLLLHWAVQFQHDPGVDPTGENFIFGWYAENGVAQRYRHGDSITTRGPTGGQNPTSETRRVMSGVEILTVLDFDLLDDPGPTYTSYTATPGLYGLESGIVPLGWDFYPVLELQHRTIDISGFEVEHFGMLIAKVA